MATPFLFHLYLCSLLHHRPRLLVSGLTNSEATAVLEAAAAVTGISFEAHTVHGIPHRMAALHGLELDEDMESTEIVDEMLGCLDDELEAGTEPILIAFTPNEVDSDVDLLHAARAAHAEQWDLQRPVSRTPTTWTASRAREVMHVELDGAIINGRWDCSTVAVYDGVIDDDLRSRLLGLLGSAAGWQPDAGPDVLCWEREGFRDVLGDESEGAPSWGLTDDALGRLCSQSPTPGPVLELQSRLQLLIDAANPGVACTVCRMPPAALGDEVPPLAANAPTAAEDRAAFNWHIDADPMLLPPSPWTDYYSRYPNRDPGRPRFVTALLYLPAEWRAEWGAPTRFLDTPTARVLETTPSPGRLILMDQDITHSVTAPNALAGDRPRYSLVLKLVVHPPDGGPLITPRLARSEAVLFGSAARKGEP